MTRAKDISKILTDADISGTLDVTGETTLATHLNLGDNDKIKLGTSQDLELYHDGNDSNIADVGTGTLLLKTDGAGIYLQKGSSETLAQFKTDGAVNLYYDNSKTFETVSGGAKVTGDLEVTDDIDLNSDSAKITFGGTSETIILEHVADTGLNLQGSGTNTNFSLLSFHTSNSTVADLRLGKSSNNTVGTFEVTASGEALGQIRFTGQDSNNSTREGAMISVDQSASSTTTTVPSDMKFFTTGSERMRILNNGDVGINSTSSSFGGFGPAHLVVNTNQSRNSIIVGNNRQNNVAYGVQADGTTGTRYAMYILNSSGGEAGKISYTHTAVTYATTSDYRLKESITYDFDATTRLKQLKPCRFNFISDETNTLVDGFLAHEAQAVVPECVTGTHNEVDADGKAIMQGIDQSKIVPLLTKTILELEARITALEGA